MRSPREARRQMARQSILDAGRKLVAQHGPQNLSLRAVAKEANYSPAALYEYFADKDALLAALTTEVAAALAEALSKIPDDLPPIKRVVALGEAYVSFALAPPADFALMFMESRSKRRSLDGLTSGRAALCASRQKSIPRHAWCRSSSRSAIRSRTPTIVLR